MLISSKVLQMSDIKVKTFLEALKLVHVDGKKATINTCGKKSPMLV